MKIEIVQRNYVAKEKLTDLIDKKVQKFEKYLDAGANAKVVLSKAGSQERYKMEVTIKDKNLFVRSEVESDNMYVNLDTCLSKIERQIVKHQDKLTDKRSAKAIDPADLLFFDELPEFTKPKITKRKKYDLFPMSEEEAIEQLELIGNDFYVFLNQATQNVNVIYKRADDDYGIIETSL